MGVSQATIGGVMVERNFIESEMPFYIPFLETSRALDGSLVSYQTGVAKKRYDLGVAKATAAQKASLDALYAAKAAVAFSLGDGTLSFTAYIMSPPQWKEEWSGMWSGKIELEEV
jgi:hypothetical protein